MSDTIEEVDERTPALPPPNIVIPVKPDEVIIQPNQLENDTDHNKENPTIPIDFISIEFDDETVCKAFIRKVYIILLCQLLLAFGILAILSFHEPTKEWIDNNNYMLWVAIAIFIITIISMLFCNRIRRKKPLDIIMLIIFTAAHSLLLAFMIRLFGPNVLLISVGMTSVTHFAFIIFTLQKRIKFSGWLSALIIILTVGIIFGISAIFLHNNLLPIILSSVASIFFSFYIIFDLKLMMDNEHTYSIKPNEYCFAAVNLYLDAINVFIYSIKRIFHCLFGESNHKNKTTIRGN